MQISERDQELLDLARATAEEAAALIRAKRADGVRVAATKTSLTDIVTDADHAAEELVRTRLLGARPEDGFLGEEGTDIQGSTGVRWVVDPIDGTVNYLLDLPQYAVAVAAEVDGRPQVGVVVNGATGDCWYAVRGAGAWRVDASGDRRLQVRATGDLSGAVIATGFNYDVDIRARQARSVGSLLAAIADVRRFGACALDLCAVAEGRLDGYVEEGCHPWDYSAAGLIAIEAGARVQIGVGASGRTLVVAVPARVFDGFDALVTECGFTDPEGPVSPL